MMVGKKHGWGRWILLIFLVVLAGLGVWRYQQSSLLITAGDQYLRQGNPDEAIVLYLAARRLFPFRPDVNESLKGARLILQSDAQYGSVYQISEVVQTVPPGLGPIVSLKLGEYHIPILMYHHIRLNPRPSDPVWAALNISPDQLDNQLKYLATHNFHSVTLDELANVFAGKSDLPDNPLILTFDDGYETFYTNAFPLLQKYHMKAVSFVITDVLSNPAYLTWDQIVQMDKSGLVQFGAHSRHHPSLVYLSQQSLTDEVKGSRSDLETHLGHPVLWFAYPFGSYNDQVIRTVKDAGFVGAVSTIYGAVQSQEKAFLLPRIMIDGRFSLDNFAQRLVY